MGSSFAFALFALLSGCGVSDPSNEPPRGHGGAARDAESTSSGGAGGASTIDARAGDARGGAAGFDPDADTGPGVEVEESGPRDAFLEARIADDVSADVRPGPIAHRVLSSPSDQGPLAIVSKDGQIEWQYDALTLGGEANDAWLLANGNVVFAYKAGARELTPQKQVVWNYPAPAGSEVHSCQPLADGKYLIGEAHDGGVGFLREIDGTGKVLSTVTLNVAGGIQAHGQFREVRKTPEGTYLVTYLQLNQAMEFDATGKLLRTFPCGSFVAIRLPDGNTLISCGDAHRVIEVDPGNKVVWEVTETEVAGNRLGFAAGLQRLANGNTVICNWPGHFATDPHQPQAFELTRDKKLVWELSDPRLKWTSNVEVLDPEAMVGGAALR
jgi:outer membrane protein assembly factor BamB